MRNPANVPDFWNLSTRPFFFKGLLNLAFPCWLIACWCGNMHKVSISVFTAIRIDIFAWPVVLMTMEKHALRVTNPQRPARKTLQFSSIPRYILPISASFFFCLNPFLLTVVSLTQQTSGSFKEGKVQGFSGGQRSVCFGGTSGLTWATKLDLIRQRNSRKENFLFNRRKPWAGPALCGWHSCWWPAGFRRRRRGEWGRNEG